MIAELRRLGWGRCVVDRPPKPYPGERYMLDNGAYAQFSGARKKAGMDEITFLDAGQPGLTYDWTRFERQLGRVWEMARLDPARAPRFAVLPDLVGQGSASLEHSLEWLHTFERRLLAAEPAEDPWTLYGGWKSYFFCEGFPWYLAVQNGMEPADLDAECGECGMEIRTHLAGVLLGGTNDWKASEAGRWAEYCHEWQMPLHYARCGTLRKVDHAIRIDASSLDSALPLWTMERFREFEHHLTHGSAQIALDFSEAA